MEKKKFAFMMMGSQYDPAVHQSRYETARQIFYLRTVRNLAEAKTTLRELEDEGVGAIELCGAFGEAGAKALVEESGGRLPIGYVVNFPQQAALAQAFFSDFEA